MIYLRSRQQESFGLDEFLVLGLIALAYGIAILMHAYGFLAVFAAGLALQRVKEQGATVGVTPAPVAASTDEPQLPGAFMMQAVRGFNEQMERIGEVAVVLIIGAMLSLQTVDFSLYWFVLLVFFLVRPVSVWLGLIGAPVSRDQRVLISWFGIRGIGSIYYLMYAINHGLPPVLAEQITTITLTTVTASILLHGISVTPLMALYGRRKRARSQ